ncbi:6-carboxytetrahydropterin synthase [Stetteria hydrogenophila]
MTTWEVCASSWVNVTLKLKSKGYPVHGHDVYVTACLRGSRSGLVLFDIEELRVMLESILSRLHYSDLAESLKLQEASLEDLVYHVYSKLEEQVKGRGLEVSLVEARVPSGTVRLIP